MGIDVNCGTRFRYAMSDQGELRNRCADLIAKALEAREDGHLDYAARLIAMALNARNKGHLEYAERLQKASEILNTPTGLERLGTQCRAQPRAIRSR